MCISVSLSSLKFERALLQMVDYGCSEKAILYVIHM